ncbi:MAG TPA: ArsA family ATPase [Chloroflexia bacterium]|nr:ArsA family ATPase [Chloroflexia bacterium]
MRIVLYVGKGGVGKTTVSAATAVRSAEEGFRTLVVSTDLAHSLADSLGVTLKSTPTEIAHNLWAQEINVLDEVREHWSKLEGYFAAMLKKKGAEDVVAEELALLPGMDEIISLLQIWKHARSGSYDAVIIDAAPTGETVRLLSMPELFNWYASRINNWHTRTLSLAGPLLKPLMPRNNIFEAIPELASQVEAMRKVFIDPQISSYRVVLNPEKMVIKEAQRAATYLSLFNYPVDAVVMNRVLPDTSPDPFFNVLCGEQQHYRDLAYRSFAPLPMLEIPMQRGEVVGLPALSGLGQLVYQHQSPLAIFYKGVVQQIVKINGEYVLKMPLPHVELDKVIMTKKGDDLIVEIGNFKRDMVLPQSLASRNAKGASFKDGVLQVRFN